MAADLLSGPDQVRALLEATGLSVAEAARALDVDARRLLELAAALGAGVAAAPRQIEAET